MSEITEQARWAVEVSRMNTLLKVLYFLTGLILSTYLNVHTNRHILRQINTEKYVPYTIDLFDRKSTGYLRIEGHGNILNGTEI
jgi:hypothetical protein